MTTVSGTPLAAVAWGSRAGALCASDSTGVGEAGARLAPGTSPCGNGVPGTLGPKPAGLASGEPAGAMLTGACTPAGPGDAWAKLGTVAGGVDGNPRPATGLGGLPAGSWGVSPGRAEKNAVAIWARSAGLIGASGASGTPTEVEGMLLTADYL